MTTPEQRARQNIDRLLEAAGWRVQDRRDLNLGAGLGVAVREFQLSTGPADYLLFVERKAIGVVEAKPEGTTLSGVEPQSAKYSIDQVREAGFSADATAKALATVTSFRQFIDENRDRIARTSPSSRTRSAAPT